MKLKDGLNPKQYAYNHCKILFDKVYDKNEDKIKLFNMVFPYIIKSWEFIIIDHPNDSFSIQVENELKKITAKSFFNYYKHKNK